MCLTDEPWARESRLAMPSKSPDTIPTRVRYIDPDFLVQVLVELCQTPSPTGLTEPALALVERKLKAVGVGVSRTRKGAILAYLPGRTPLTPQALTAHVDTLGAMVKGIKDNGRLWLTQLGTYAWETIEGEYCLIHTQAGRAISGTILTTHASAHVHGQELHRLERNAASIEVRIDEPTSSRDETEALGIAVGDFVTLDTRTQVTESGYIKSRHLDDKAGAAVLLGLAQALGKGGLVPARTTYLLFSHFEEVGHGATAGLPAEVGELIAVDMAAVGDGQTSDEQAVTICVKDSSGPYDHALSTRLRRLATAEHIPCRVDIYPYYASDASAALLSGGDFRAALVGPGVDASHSWERTHRDGLVATAQLMLAYLLDDQEHDFTS
jgi:putative aminopeptidase FrvX